MRKKSIKYSFILCAFLAFALQSVAQTVTVDASIDSLQLFIGEQTKIKLEVSLDAGKRLKMPDFDKEIINGIEIVERSEPDTQYINDNKRMIVKQEYTVTSFDTAFYYIPPITVLVDGEPYYSQELALRIYTFEVDTLHPDAFFGPKEIMELSLTWDEWGIVLILFVLLIPIIIFIILFINRYNNNKPIIYTIKVKPVIPPHIVALNEIERIKSERNLQKGGAPKEYYTELTDTIRTYIRDRFGFNAMEMTSDEIIERLIKEQEKDSLKDLIYLLETADLVKFAKHNPLMNENDLNLVNAIDFVNQTKKEEEVLNKRPEPSEVKMVYQRSKKAKMWLLVGIILLSALGIWLLIELIERAYYLWF